MDKIIKLKENEFRDIVNEIISEVLKRHKILLYEETKNENDDDFMKNAMEFMDASLSEQNKPKVGIFWYSPELKDVFGVISVNADVMAQTEHRTYVSCKELHKDVWKKNYNYDKFHNNDKSLFKGDYKNTPRGRVFYDTEEDKFIIAVGSWIDNFPEAIQKIKEEFNLNNPKIFVEVKNGIHWEIGMGYGE